MASILSLSLSVLGLNRLLAMRTSDRVWCLSVHLCLAFLSARFESSTSHTQSFGIIACVSVRACVIAQVWCISVCSVSTVYWPYTILSACNVCCVSLRFIDKGRALGQKAELQKKMARRERNKQKTHGQPRCVYVSACTYVSRYLIISRVR